MSQDSVHEFTAKNIDGREQSLSEFAGRVLLVVNVASECGFTPQYAGLEALYRKYRDRGFAVLGFPCNQFGAQEPGSEAEIQEFCATHYERDVSRCSPRSTSTGPIPTRCTQCLKSAEPGLLGTEAIKWNFTKFLIGRDGKVIKRYAPTTKPEAIEPDIEAALDAA